MSCQLRSPGQALTPGLDCACGSWQHPRTPPPACCLAAEVPRAVFPEHLQQLFMFLFIMSLREKDKKDQVSGSMWPPNPLAFGLWKLDPLEPVVSPCGEGEVDQMITLVFVCIQMYVHNDNLG